METVKSLLDAVKKAENIESDYALAKAMKLNKARISAYYAKKEVPNEIVCLRIAKSLGRSYEEITAIVRIEAEKDEERREEWRDYLKRLGGYAAAIMLWVLAGLVYVTLELSLPKKVYAESTTYDSALIHNTNYALKKIAKAAGGFVRSVLEILAPRVCFSG